MTTLKIKNGMFVTPPKEWELSGEHLRVGYLTPNKKYRVNNQHGNIFTINTDIGEDAYCTLEKCAHLGGLNWKIVKK